MVVGTFLSAFQSQEGLLLLTGFVGGYIYLLNLRKKYDLRGFGDKGLAEFDLGILSLVFFITFLYMSIFLTLPFWIYTDMFGDSLLQAWVFGQFIIIMFLGLNFHKPVYYHLQDFLDIEKGDRLYDWKNIFELAYATLIATGFTILAYSIHDVEHISSLFGPQPFRFFVVSLTGIWGAIQLWDANYGISNYVFEISELNAQSTKQKIADKLDIEIH